MEPGVPFALLGSVQLLAVAAWLGLAGTCLALGRGARGPALLAALGAVVLAAVDVRTGLRFGDAVSDELAIARCAGALLLAAGLYAGALASSPGAAPPADQVGARLAALGAVPLAGVVVPLGAAPAPAALAAVSAGVAAVAGWRALRGRSGVVLGLGLLLTGIAVLLGPIADDGPTQASTASALRGLGAVGVLAALVVVARTSLLSKVVAAILAGVLVMASAAVGVVGTVVTSSFDDQAASLVEQAAQGRLQALTTAGEVGTGYALLAQNLAERDPALVDGFLIGEFGPRGQVFAALVTKGGRVKTLGGRARLSGAEALALGQDDAVRFALESTGSDALVDPQAFLIRLVGDPPTIALVVLAPATRPTPDSPAPSVLVYGQRLGDDYAAEDFDAGGYGLSLLVGDRVVASNRTEAQERQLEQIARREGVGSGIDRDGTTLRAEGSSPTVRFVPLQGFDGEQVGLLALSRGADESLSAQREALRVLLLTALVTTALVAGVAVLLGRRTVEPVRRLTEAAQRIGAGDLTARAVVRSNDEVGTLSRTFDAMTGNLSRLTDDLRDSAARLSTVLASMSDGLVATDGSGLITSVNRAAVLMAGLPEERAAVGRPLGEVFEVLGPGGEQLADVQLRLRDAPGEVHPLDGGSLVPVRVAITPLDSGDGVVIVLRDTTREREVERMKTEFLSNVSHELRTPLTPIRGYADILVTKGATLRPEQVTTFSETILAESIKMNRVVDLLVDVASIEAGRVQVVPRPVAAGALIDELLATWKGRAPDRAADLRRRVAARLPAVHVDPRWVGKALDELVDNAVKYTPPGTPIALIAALAPDGGSVRVSVKDSGPGIAEADRAALFTSFEQVDGSATRKVGGLGLGLSFVRRLAEDAGFPLTVMSTVGTGSEFALDLPLSEEPVPRAARQPRRPAVPPKAPPLKKSAPEKKAAPAKKGAPAKKAPAKKAVPAKAPVKKAGPVKKPVKGAATRPRA